LEINYQENSPHHNKKNIPVNKIKEKYGNSFLHKMGVGMQYAKLINKNKTTF
jgi:hypothetical protein